MRHQQKNKEIAHVKKQMKEGNGGGGKNNKEEDGIIRQKNGNIACCIPFLPCARVGHPLPETLEDGVKLSCTNPDCLYSKHLVHIECFRSLETNLMKLLTSQGYRYCRKEGILLTQEMLWEPKGLSLLQKNLKCECGKGKMSRDDEAWQKRQALVEPPTEEKEKKKHKPTAALPTLQLTVKKGAPPPPNFHQLNSHYLSSHSPTRSDAYIEDKYGPPLAVKTRTRSSNSVTSNDSKPPIVIPSPAVKKPTLSFIHSPIVKKTSVPTSYAPQSPTIKKPAVPIGYAPIESSFPKLPEAPSEFKLPDPVASNTVLKSKVPEPTPRVWSVVAHAPKSKPVECNVEAQLKNHTVQSEITNHTVESKPSEVLQKEISINETTPAAYSCNNNISKSKKYVSIEVQTDETSFDQSFNRSQWSTNYYHPKEYAYDSESTDYINPKPIAPINYTGSLYGYIGDRRSRNTTSSGFASVSDADFSTYQTSTPKTEEVFSGFVTFLFRNDETCAVEVYKNGRKQKVLNGFDNEWTPLYFSMAERTPEIGEKAQIHHIKAPGFVLYDIFKVIGKPMNQIVIDPKWKFKVIENNGIKCFEIQTQNGIRAFPENLIIASFLKSLKARADTFLNTEISEIYFSSNFDLTESQKDVFKNAASKVGLDILNFYVIDVQ